MARVRSYWPVALAQAHARLSLLTIVNRAHTVLPVKRADTGFLRESIELFTFSGRLIFFARAQARYAMFKRPAHVLFLSASPGDLARNAYDAATRLGDRWLEGRAACVAISPSARPTCAVEPVNAALFEWADLVVTLDELAERYCLSRPPAVRHKHWSLTPGQSGGEAGNALSEQIEARVASMVGGLRMLARSDAGADANPEVGMNGIQEAEDD